MCGIVGYIGFRNATDVLIDGLRRLEYRGYDSAGVAVRTPEGLKVVKRSGKLSALERALKEEHLEGPLGVGHTRWATHGAPTDPNAHPHTTEDGTIAVIHNGIIENYLELKEALRARGHRFASDTDSEVLAHLIEEKYRGNLFQALKEALKEVRGAYAVVAVHKDHQELVAARTVSPLVIGLGEGENFLASDVPALLPYTRRVIFLHDGDLARITREGVVVTDLEGRPLSREAVEVDWTLEAAEKGGFPHYMLKEIYEQPWVLENTLGGRLREEEGDVELGLSLDPKAIDRIHVIACGTASYAGWYGKYLLEALARISTEWDVASEYRYRDPVADERTLAIAISQSGETIDTLEGLREAKAKGAKTLGIINAKGSSLTREVEDVLYIHAGPEIGVASTKAYTAMLSAMAMLAVHLGRGRGILSQEEARELIREMRKLPRLVEEVLEKRPIIAHLAEKYHQAQDFLFLGRHVQAPTAYEGALKLKEISYIHAEAYPAGEMKHGPIALIDEHLPVVVLATQGPLYEKTLSNIQEVRARGGKVIAIATLGDAEIAKLAQDVLYVPEVHPLLAPIVSVVPLQLLAYEIAVLLGRDVDQPRNLAKSVTVE
ncbi:glutamine--fructose-6-phosphate transaminase (isomerizing) [Thermus scotoductus]|uniref:Glutamine--fructose-6-phosphate aminotransferase [isomerizing] n=1 Tax=Thermus scotoductus TaxID=37636 RepID=A0A430R2E3_THESC|nr:glutamine--fructose-6-phosphate transaminase (isomerizing) [Thermus scotoductus]RTG93853.1 glutamine--fructose-6-phosphate transaminase (isomerizing) [Thermus scotoductus]RTH01493.1 glutamine--fructose-6-phosphate transaminase (isomerizing) [Thermus scotoductus]RTH18056.1 glutamine--fructose-6-phosphate transaminase (isomerizing) [Thermus scotoductus]RTH97338.1 glutamine--fructose-6-phosphate transaminase (isomerizing) [Thermus scotoductus]RTI18846.1 glutamine--fructose-6-phosphate transami